MKNLALLFIALFIGCSTPTTGIIADYENSSSSTSNCSSSSSSVTSGDSANYYIEVDEFGEYTTKDSVAAYICEFNKPPSNYVGKDEGQALYEELTGNTFSSWNFNPWKTLDVMIGGDSFTNSDGILPDGTYHEADVDYGNQQNRGTKRLIYQSGCIIYYTADHYASFSEISISR